jgi:hypothetical protein
MIEAESMKKSGSAPKNERQGCFSQPLAVFRGFSRIYCQPVRYGWRRNLCQGIEMSGFLDGKI